MPQQVTDIDVLKNYLKGVMDRADHHAQNVNEISLAIAGGVLWRKDDEALEVMTRDGDMKNVLWFRARGQRYALSYNHESGAIELRRKTTQGSVIASFSNLMSNAQVKSVFTTL